MHEAQRLAFGVAGLVCKVQRLGDTVDDEASEVDWQVDAALAARIDNLA